MTDEDELELVEIPKIVKVISNLLSEIVKNNAARQYDDKDPFASKKVTTVTVKFYLERIRKYSKLENSSLIIALIYIDRICAQNDFTLCPYNIHRILFACALVAIKYNEDSVYDNKFYSDVAGVSLEETNYLEYSCLKLLNFNLFVDEEIFSQYVGYLKGENQD